MKLIQATKQDFERVAGFYRDAVARTAHMDVFARWVYGKHPTDAMLRGYIESGALQIGEQDGSLVSAVAVTPQSSDYHDTQWALPLADDEVAVVHLLCVFPDSQGKGIGRETMQQVIAHSRAAGKRAVRLDALTSNTPAHRLYESLGFCWRGQQRWHTDNVGWADFFLYELVLYENRKKESNNQWLR